jgi:D-alanyl-D-alanine carboxypeptidase
MRPTVLLLLLLLLGAGPVRAQARADLAARIDSIVNAELAAGRAPGLGVAVVRGSDTVVLRGYGVADVENAVPVTDRSVFRIGSLTKQFTAAAVLKQVEEGRIRLDAPISEYLPEYAGPGRRVTVRQLLNHTSGIPSYTGLGERFWGRSRLDLTHAQMLELFAADSLEFEPGSRFSYNNSGYYLLGVLLEKVTGAGYGAHVAATQFAPLGMTQTLYCDQAAIVPHRVQGYDVRGNALINAAPISMLTPGAAGALCSTPRDLVKWTAALNRGRVVSAASYAQMTAPTTLTGGTTQPYGFGLSRGELEGHAVIQHSGGVNGFSAFMSHYPADDLTIVVLANGGTNTGMVAQRIARAALGLAAPANPEIALAPAALTRYTGTFDLAPALPFQVRVFVDNGRLTGQATGQGPIPLRFIGNDTFLGPDGSGIRMVFSVENDRAVSFTLHQGGREAVARRID